MYPKQSYVHLTRIFKHSNMCSEIRSFIWCSEKIKSSKCCAFIACIHSSIFIKTSIKSDSSSNYIYEEWALHHIFTSNFPTFMKNGLCVVSSFQIFQHLWRMGSASYLHFKIFNLFMKNGLWVVSSFQILHHLWRRGSTSYLHFKIFNIYEEWTLRRIFISNCPTFMKKGLYVVSSFQIFNIYEERALRRIFILNLQLY